MRDGVHAQWHERQRLPQERLCPPPSFPRLLPLVAVSDVPDGGFRPVSSSRSFGFGCVSRSRLHFERWLRRWTWPRHHLRVSITHGCLSSVSNRSTILLKIEIAILGGPRLYAAECKVCLNSRISDCPSCYCGHSMDLGLRWFCSRPPAPDPAVAYISASSRVGRIQ